MESGDEPRPKATKDGHVMHVGAGNRFQRGSGPDPAAFEVEATEPDGVRASLRVKTRSRGATPQSSGTRRMRVPFPSASDSGRRVSSCRRRRHRHDSQQPTARRLAGPWAVRSLPRVSVRLTTDGAP